MPRPPDLARRAELVDALVDAYAAHGLTRSLRELATELGTSHRMLLHHFGSREEMLVAVVKPSSVDRPARWRRRRRDRRRR